MAYVKNIFDRNFLEYASYVIKDRAIPDLEDGLKPVQRRILHSLFEMDDGKFHKVANVVGHTMQYHPHGDASIGSALVVLANKDYFIESGHSNYPTRMSYYQDPYWKNSPLRMQYFEYAIKESLPWWWPVPEMYPAILNISGERVVGDALQKIILGMDPMQAAAESDKAVQVILKTYN